MLCLQRQLKGHFLVILMEWSLINVFITNICFSIIHLSQHDNLAIFTQVCFTRNAIYHYVKMSYLHT